MKVIAQPNHESHSEYLRFARKADSLFLGQAADGPGLSFLRLEFTRIRPGMADFLIRIATPVVDPEKENTVVTVRASRKQASNAGAMGTAKVIQREMKSRGDASFNWDAVNLDHLARMIAAPIKFFATSINSESMQYATEALT